MLKVDAGGFIFLLGLADNVIEISSCCTPRDPNTGPEIDYNKERSQVPEKKPIKS